MNFGYLIVVSKSDDVDYASLAYGLALSIKNTQREGYDKVALVIDDKTELERFESPWVFDEVIEWDKETFWDGRSWMDELSPFEYTVCLDADMVFVRDTSHWVEYFIENSELYVSNKAYTYRGDIVTSDYYRQAFVKNELPNLYSFYTFFKKNSKLAKEFFNLGRSIIKNPVEYSNLFLANYKPKILGTDEAFALAAKILDIVDKIAYPLEFPKVAHLKSQVQNVPLIGDILSNHIGFYFDSNGQIKIGNYQQYDIVHYVEKDKMDKEVISQMELIAWNK